MQQTPFTEDQKKRVSLLIAGSAMGGALIAFLITSLILSKKYAKLETQYWSM